MYRAAIMRFSGSTYRSHALGEEGITLTGTRRHCAAKRVLQTCTDATLTIWDVTRKRGVTVLLCGAWSIIGWCRCEGNALSFRYYLSAVLIKTHNALKRRGQRLHVERHELLHVTRLHTRMVCCCLFCLRNTVFVFQYSDTTFSYHEDNTSNTV